MERKIDIKKLLKSLRTDEFVRGCKMPMGYSYGLPIVKIANGKPCVVVPFLKYKMTGVIDKTLIYPIRNTVTISLPDENFVSFEDLRFNESFCKVDFDKPIGYFRPDNLKQFNKNEYNQLKDELYELYNKFIYSLLYDDGEFSGNDNARMKELISLLVEPCLCPIYKALDREFYDKYLA